MIYIKNGEPQEMISELDHFLSIDLSHQEQQRLMREGNKEVRKTARIKI